MWVPLVENGELLGTGAAYFVEKEIQSLLQNGPSIDAIFLACTHYPILKESIIKYLPSSVMVFDQGDLVAKKLTNYFKRHPIVNNHLSKDGKIEILTTEKSEKFDQHLDMFYDSNYTSKTVQIN